MDPIHAPTAGTRIAIDFLAATRIAVAVRPENPLSLPGFVTGVVSWHGQHLLSPCLIAVVSAFLQTGLAASSHVIVLQNFS